MGFFSDASGSQLRSPWSDLSEFRIIVTCMKLAQKCSRKRDDAIFPTVTLSVAMETSGRICLNLKLIQALMHVLIICKYEKDPIKIVEKM